MYCSLCRLIEVSRKLMAVVLPLTTAVVRRVENENLCNYLKMLLKIQYH
jgi:hypothetical protein